MLEHTVCIIVNTRASTVVRSSLTKASGKVEDRNEAYYNKYPEDVDRVKVIVQYLKEHKVALPSGILTPARFQQLGLVLGMHGK